MMTTPLVSIIVPIYNVEKYLVDCLTSILKQTYVNFECICVNDGSTDNSAYMIEEFCKHDSRFILINQENQGLSGARNTGIESAIGGWLCFVDSDDMICPSMLEKFTGCIEKESCDYISCNYVTIPQELSYESVINYSTHKSSPAQVSFSPLYDVIDNKLPYRVSACMHLYSKELFQNVRFDTEMRIHEDTYISIMLLQKAKKAVHIADSLYIYRDRNGSLTRSSVYELSANNLKKNIYLGAEFAKKLKLNKKAFRSLISKCGADELSNVAVCIVLNKSLSEKERTESINSIKVIIIELREVNLYSLKNLNFFIKTGIYISYYLNSPYLFRLVYSVLWHKQWIKE